MLDRIKRRVEKTSFATILPLSAFALSLVLSLSIFTFAFYARYQATIEHNSIYYTRVSQTIAPSLAENDPARTEQLITDLLPNGAVVQTPDGKVFAGRFELAPSEAVEAVPITLDGRQLGQLVPAPISAFKPPISHGFALILCFGMALISALFARVYAQISGKNLNRLTSWISQLKLEDNDTPDKNGILFTEYRALRAASIRTIRRLAREIEVLRSQAVFDPNTGLPNELHAQGRLDQLIAESNFRRPAGLIALEIFETSDVSTMIRLNMNDQILQKVVERLKQAVADIEKRQHGTQGAWDLSVLFSKQFVLQIPNLRGRDQLGLIAEELRYEVERPVQASEFDRSISISASAAIMLVPEDGDTPSVVRKRAETMLDTMRRQGKSDFAFYSPKIERQREARYRLEQEIRDAVAQDAFVPVFQPKIDLQTGRICGAEALARWQMPDGRLVTPNVFIDVAEDIGIIGKIGDQILRKACDEAALWVRNGHRLNIAVNVSPRQFEQDGLSETVIQSLRQSGLSPRQLELEITESVAIEQPHRVRDVIEPLRRLGIKLAIDDFGTGHSNLAALTQIKFDVFKIDRQFVSGLPGDRHGVAIVEMVLSMAKTLDMTIVGEGIETAEQGEFLRCRQCHIGQGFHYSRPLPAKDFRELLERDDFKSTMMIA